MGKKVVNARAIRESLERLDRLALEHPELLAREGEDCSPESWEEVLKKEVFVTGRPKGEETALVTVRLPVRLLDEIQAKGDELSAEGLALSRTGVIRYLLEQSLKPGRLGRKESDG